MNPFKIVLIVHVIFLMSITGYTQKQSFGVVSFTVPKGWQQQQNEAGIQLLATDEKKDAYAIAIITKAASTNADANGNFSSDWNKLIKASVQVNDAPAMQEPVKENGWDIISGTANYTDGEKKGMVTLLTATGGGQMVSVVLITNSNTYQNDLLSLVQSLEITAAGNKQAVAASNATASADNNGAIVGLWTDYFNETSGYVNGVPQYSAGYFRKEYVFYADGRYLFRQKNWSVYTKDILFNYETGTYKVQGKKLTITPVNGKGGWWGKAPGGSTKGWGSKVKASERKLQTVTYDVNWETYSGVDHPFLVLYSPTPTEREGNNKNYQAKFRSKPLNETMIDNPPGINTGF